MKSFRKSEVAKCVDSPPFFNCYFSRNRVKMQSVQKSAIDKQFSWKRDDVTRGEERQDGKFMIDDHRSSWSSSNAKNGRKNNSRKRRAAKARAAASALIVIVWFENRPGIVICCLVVISLLVLLILLELLLVMVVILAVGANDDGIALCSQVPQLPIKQVGCTMYHCTYMWLPIMVVLYLPVATRRSTPSSLLSSSRSGSVNIEIKINSAYMYVIAKVGDLRRTVNNV